LLKEVLTGILRPAHRTAGLFLEEQEDFLYLKKEGQEKPLATFIVWMVTVEMIRYAADSILEKE